MKFYILQDKEQIIKEMSQEEIMQYCEDYGLSVFFFVTSFITNDWNWHIQYPEVLYICAKTIEEAREFILKAYYKAHEYDGDYGVVFKDIQTLYVGGAAYV